MPISIWEYLRERARDAVLAGIKDAMDVVEQGDTNGSQHDQANGLASRLNPPKQLTGATGQAPAESHAPDAAQEAAEAAPSPAPGKSQPTPDEFDSDLQKRLQDAAPTTPPQTKTTTRFREPNGQPLRKRGRSKKETPKDDDE